MLNETTRWQPCTGIWASRTLRFPMSDYDGPLCRCPATITCTHVGCSSPSEGKCTRGFPCRSPASRLPVGLAGRRRTEEEGGLHSPQNSGHG